MARYNGDTPQAKVMLGADPALLATDTDNPWETLEATAGNLHTDIKSINGVAVAGSSLPVVGNIAINNLNTDAFGRLRVANPSAQLDLKQNVDRSNYIWTSSTANGATAVYTQANASTVLALNGTASGKAVLQSRAKGIYFPGKSTEVFMTFILNPEAITNGYKRVGYFDDNNGLFLESDASGTVKCVVRNNTVDVSVEQASWDDPMDGTGESGIVLDFTKDQIMFIDFEWLGVGSVRFGFAVDGVIYYVHSFHHANNIDSGVYMGNSNLPLRWEIAGDSAASLEAICGTVIAEGGEDNIGRKISVGTIQANGTTDPSSQGKVIGTGGGELLAIRLASTYVDRANIIPLSLSVYCSTNSDFLWQIVLNDTSVTRTVWTAGGTISEVCRDGTGSDFASGLVLASGFGTTAADLALEDINSVLKAGGSVANVADIISLRIVKVGTNNDTYYGTMSVLEQT